MTEQEIEIINAIKALKKERKKGWHMRAKKLWNDLEKLRDPFGSLEWRGTEALGRHHATDSLPIEDDYGEESNP